MRALLSERPGGPETLILRDIPRPEPGDREVLLRVRACSINYPDALIIEDLYQIRPERPFSPGCEVAGVVEQAGRESGFEPGQRVMASGSHGGLADYMVVDAQSCVLMPDAMPFDDAACFLMTYGTSYYALKQRGALAKGQTLLVLGAGGGVGLAAVELGRAFGANVVGAVSSEAKAAAAQARGADHSVIYPTGPFDDAGRRALGDLLKTACGETGADVVFDAVGGAYSDAALRGMAWEGRFLVVGFPAGIPKIALNRTLLKSCQIVGVLYGQWRRRDPEAAKANIAELLALYQNGSIRPTISHRFPLARAAEAIALIKSRNALGKIVVSMDEAPSRREVLPGSASGL